MDGKRVRLILLVVVLLVVVGAVVLIESSKVDVRGGGTTAKSVESGTLPFISNESNSFMSPKEKGKKYPKAKELTAVAEYLNLPEGVEMISLSEMIGKKVILLDIWTYSCINCQRTLPYITSWYDKYEGDGLEIIGVHTPEFEFEKNPDNVNLAIEKFGIKYPVVLDNDYGTWRAYNNRYWPRKYLIDIDGFVVYDHIGEGGYQETERKIQELLAERAERLKIAADVSKELSSFDTGAPKVAGNSPEIYFGASRNTALGNGQGGVLGEQTLSEPEGFKTHILYLDGRWDFSKEAVENKVAGDRIIYRYVAKNVFFVAGAEAPVVAEIRRDGQPLTKEAAGVDIYFEDGKSLVKIYKETLYNLVSQEAQEEHTLEIIPQTPGLVAFTFTFG